MRNLKKFLALVLAMMMAMSLMVTANAAVTSNVEYSDSYQANEDFEEAITVLSGMEVIQGYNGGETFMPQSNITRAEAAMLIYRLATGDVKGDKVDLYIDYGPTNAKFADVKSDAWYAGAVGYCANFGIAKGRSDGLFHPSDNVTGYEILAMILRVVGYDKNGEFSGGDWTYNVATLSTSLGVTNQVKTANYSKGGTSNLYAPATREVVASLLFETIANVPKVIYSDSLRYMDTGLNGGILSGVKNPTIGYEVFGLTTNTGVVVGNEATGEGKSVTKVGFSLDSSVTGTNVMGSTWTPGPDTDSDGEPDYWISSTQQNNTYSSRINNDVTSENGYAYEYFSTRNNGRPVSATSSFKWDSGLDMFGHAVKVWYNAKDSANKRTYAMFDKATNVAVVDGVTASTIDLNNSSNPLDSNELYDKATMAGFRIGDQTYWNYSFGRSAYGADPASASARGFSGWSSNFASPIGVNNRDEINGGATTANPLYLLISNSADKTLDLVISLDMSITRITQRNNTTTGNYSVGVFNENGTGTQWFDVEDTESVGTTQTYANILERALVGNSTKDLGDKVAAIEITGTNGKKTDHYGSNTDNTEGMFDNNSFGLYATQSNYYYQLTKLTHVVNATVVRFDDKNETIYLSDGSKMEKSVFANAVDGTFKDNQYVNAPRNYGTYSFTLDKDGKYIYWEPINETSNFVYGTYLDYTTVTASSSFDYPLVYVDTNGAKGQANITKLNGNVMSYSQYTGSGLNRRSQTTTATDAGYVKGAYIGYALSDSGQLMSVTSTDDKSTGFYQATASNFGNAVIKLTSRDLAIGAQSFGTTGNLMLTENTKFYIVDGAGNDNQKVNTYNGISELMKGMSQVEIDVTTSAKLTTKAGTYLAQNVNPYEMVYYKAGWAEYGQNYEGSAEEVKVVYIPKECVKFTPAVDSNLFFVGDSSSKMFNSYGEKATLFTMYQNGLEVQRWIKGENTDDAAIVNTLGDNVFYCLIPTSKKANDGETIYEIAEVTRANEKVIGQYYDGLNNTTPAVANIHHGGGNIAYYAATTYSSQIAYIDGTGHASNSQLYNVGKATVMNLSGMPWQKYPGIVNTLSSLNNAGSITDNVGVPVSCVLDSNDTEHLTVAHIYVNANA